MSVIRNLVLREWFKSFLGAVIVLLVLVSVANILSNLLRENVTAKEVLLNYLIDLPNTLLQIFPVSCLIASLFSINKLKNRNELTAIFAGGFSRRSYMLTVCQGALIIAALQFFVGAYLQPSMRYWRTGIMSESAGKFKNLKSEGLKASTLGSGKIWYKTDKYFFSFIAYDKNTNTLSDVGIYYYDQNHHLSRKLEARRAEFFKDHSWNFIEGREVSNLSGEDFPEIKDFKNYTGTINETPNDFKQIEADITILNIQELYEYIQRLDAAGINTNQYYVIFYERIASPLVCVLFALIAGTLVFNPNRRSSSFGKSISFVFVFVLAYWLINSLARALGESSRISPLIACFSVPVIFIIYLSHYFYKHRHLR